MNVTVTAEKIDDGYAYVVKVGQETTGPGLRSVGCARTGALRPRRGDDVRCLDGGAGHGVRVSYRAVGAAVTAAAPATRHAYMG